MSLADFFNRNSGFDFVFADKRGPVTDDISCFRAATSKTSNSRRPAGYKGHNFHPQSIEFFFFHAAGTDSQYDFGWVSRCVDDRFEMPKCLKVFFGRCLLAEKEKFWFSLFISHWFGY